MAEATDVLFVWSGQAFPFALDLGLKSLLLCLAALVVQGVVGRRRILVRSAVWNACVLGLALLPLAALLFPQMTLNVIRERGAVDPGVRNVQRGAEHAGRSPAGETLRAAAILAPPPGTETRALTPRNAIGHGTGKPARVQKIDGTAIAMLIYFAVLGGLLVRLSLSLAAVSRLRRSGVPLAEREWSERLARWRERFGIGRQVQLLKSDRVDVPVVVGWRRPAILAPERLAAAEERTIDAVLLHELAHVRRGDYGWNLLLRLVQALYWPNPLVWLMARAIGRVREQACDELCIHWLGGAEAYRATLLELAGGLLRRPLAALGMAMAGSSRLQRRLAQIDSSSGRPQSQSRRPLRVAALAFAALVAGALGALRVTSGAAGDEPKKPLTQAEVDEQPVPEAKAPEQTPKPSAVEPPANAAGSDAGSAPAEKPEQPLKVRVDKVRREDFAVQVNAAGDLKSSRSTELYARVAGTIVARNVYVGDRVKAGQVLAEIDAPELDAELEQAKVMAEEGPATVEQAQGKLDEALAGLEAANAGVAKSEADWKQAATQSEFLEKAHQRLLNTANQVPQRQIDEKESQVQAAQGTVNVAKAQLAAAKAEVKHAEATVSVAKAGLRIAQLQSAAAQQRLQRVARQAEFRKVAAPVDGVVAREAAEPGYLAKLGGEPLFVISNTDRMTMQTQIPERDALRVVPGQHCQVWLDSERDGKPHEAKVGRVGYAIDPQTRTLPVEIDFDNPGGRLRPGMFGRVAIDLETHPNVLTMPGHPASSGEPGICFRVVDGRVVRTRFATASTSADRSEVKSGLSEGDLIIVEVEVPAGMRSISWQDGTRVEIVEPPAEGPSGAQ